MEDNKTIMYVVTPENFETWCIYYQHQKDSQGSITSCRTGYGKESLLKHLSGNETVLQTGKAKISFLLKHNNADVNGNSPFDINLTNQEYITEFIKNGAVLINPFKN